MRQVQLKGEAYFKVEANPESPFYVLLDKLNVQVTGTSFNIKAYEATDHLSITLIEGSINVREGHKLLANLSPGEMFSYSKKQVNLRYRKPIYPLQRAGPMTNLYFIMKLLVISWTSFRAGML